MALAVRMPRVSSTAAIQHFSATSSETLKSRKMACSVAQGDDEERMSAAAVSITFEERSPACICCPRRRHSPCFAASSAGSWCAASTSFSVSLSASVFIRLLDSFGDCCSDAELVRVFLEPSAVSRETSGGRRFRCTSSMAPEISTGSLSIKDTVASVNNFWHQASERDAERRSCTCRAVMLDMRPKFGCKAPAIALCTDAGARASEADTNCFGSKTGFAIPLANCSRSPGDMQCNCSIAAHPGEG
mmetsp:Transcript_11980/g.28197  ORF Transcript_11980/g.28197 Transcript_11980/m.28197 type:complete len:246 (+) Transcript_11980:1089-1826(+)